MSIEASAAGSNEPRRTPNSERAKLFPIYKSGQGYWTRLGTAIGSAAVVIFFAIFVFDQLRRFPSLSSSTRFIIAAAVVVGLALLVQWIMNGPKRAQFLIDTDSEMKKVNWASWPELIGSTRVVIFFMLLTALSLFIFDTQFHALSYALSVWLIPFETIAGVVTGLILAGTLLVVGIGLTRSHGEAKATKAGFVLTIVGAVLLIVWIAFAIFGSFGKTGAAIPAS